MIRLCTVALADAHLVEGPLEQAMISFQVEDGVVLVEETEIRRAAEALGQYGYFVPREVDT